jgi:hypothetical protein
VRSARRSRSAASARVEVEPASRWRSYSASLSPCSRSSEAANGTRLSLAARTSAASSTRA